MGLKIEFVSSQLAPEDVRGVLEVLAERHPDVVEEWTEAQYGTPGPARVVTPQAPIPTPAEIAHILETGAGGPRTVAPAYVPPPPPPAAPEGPDPASANVHAYAPQGMQPLEPGLPVVFPSVGPPALSPPAHYVQPAGGSGPADAPNLDAEGFPYDKRIHSDPPKFTGERMWRKRRGLTNATWESVRAELRQTYPAPASQATSQPSAQVTTPVPQVSVGVGPIAQPPASLSDAARQDPAAVYAALVAAQQPPQPVPSALPPPPIAASAIPAPPNLPAPPAFIPPATSAPSSAGMPDFGALMGEITAAESAGRFTRDDLLAAMSALGIKELKHFLPNPQDIPRLKDMMNQLGKPF